MGPSSYYVERIDVTATPPTRGREVQVPCRYLQVRTVPPGARATLAFHSADSPAVKIRAAETWVFAAGNGSPHKVWINWTQLSAGDDVRKEIELVFSDDVYGLPTPERVETVSAPATGGATGQKKIAVAGTAEVLNATNRDADAVLVVASSTNAAPVTIGFDAIANTADGTGQGFVLAPGQSVTLAVDSPHRLYLNAANTTDYVSWMCLNSRR